METEEFLGAKYMAYYGNILNMKVKKDTGF